MSDVHLISRIDAAKKIRQHWLDTYSKEQLLTAHEPNWERLRNYEFESDLAKAFGGEWCISEWCPFDGVYCSWKDHAPDSVIEETAKGFERDAEELRANGFAPDRLAAYVRHRGKTSPCVGCGVGVWGDAPGRCEKCRIEPTRKSDDG
jgi:hypothetical protein